MVSFNKHINKRILNSFKQSCPENEQVVITYFKSEKEVLWKLENFTIFTNP